jgi:hypothetical protein
MDDEYAAERRLQLAMDETNLESLRGSEIARRALYWEVTVYPPATHPGDWSHQARIAFDGTVLQLRRGFPKTDAGAAVEEATARARADAFLAEQGFVLDRYEAPELRRVDLDRRTDTTLRYRSKERVLPEEVRYGVAVSFAGEQLAGFSTWREDPEEQGILALLQPMTLVGNLNFFSGFVLLPFVAVFFLKRYHAGEVGVQRGLQIFGVSAALGLVVLLFTARAATQGQVWGTLTRQQISFLWGAQILLLYYLPQGLASFLSWSVGESYCRERWGRKLAAFDALFQGKWRNRTVATASLRGYAAGWALAAGLVVLQVMIGRATGAWTGSGIFLGPFWNNGPWPGVLAVLFCVGYGLYTTLFGRLFLVSLIARRAGAAIAATVATLVTGVVFFAPVTILPIDGSVPLWFVVAAAGVALFLAYDLLTALLASITTQLVLSLYPFLFSLDRGLELQGWIGLLAGALPAALTARYLLSEEEFVYRYEDVPPHVRRIAERERHRVELETARNIQSSILPQLPPQLNGVEIAHTYLPATEVGGDFYDVLALEDGRVAVAVGDVAGHGVSSGLVMSMAKSALAVQVSFDPEVAAVFTTLNRMVYQSARKRLLATLCYALVDPRRREMAFASAGHLFPYRVSSSGAVEALESVAYPLGVRPVIDVVPRTAKLEAGDTLFLCSDGLIEARREGSEEMFGFDRLERLLGKIAGNGASVVRDFVLKDLRAFTGDAPREDDLTLLVLRLP